VYTILYTLDYIILITKSIFIQLKQSHHFTASTFSPHIKIHIRLTNCLPQRHDGDCIVDAFALKFEVERAGVELDVDEGDFDFNSLNGVVDIDLDVLLVLSVALVGCFGVSMDCYKHPINTITTNYIHML